MSGEALKLELLDDLRSQFGEGITWSGMLYDMPTVCIRRNIHLQIVDWLKSSEKWHFNHFIDITAVDYFKQHEEYRYEVVVHLRSHSKNIKVRIKTPVPGEKPELPTLTTLFAGASWSEREVFDLMGIRFKGHPRMTRVLSPDDFEGHPLRKDFPVKGKHRGSFPRGTVISNKRREPVVGKKTKPDPLDHMMPTTVWEQQRAPMREEKGDA